MAKKKEKMEEPESYKLANGKTRWKFRAYVGENPKTGRQSYTNRQGFRTKTEARKALRRIKTKVDDNTYFKDNKKKKKYTYQEVYEMWFAEYQNTVAASTLLKVKRDFENRILPELGKYLITQITHKEMQALANKWGEYQRCKRWISTATRVFHYAQKHDLLEKNPSEFVTIPKPKKKEPQKMFYERDELNQFIAILNNDDNLQRIVLLRLLIYTGIRRGEALALYWECVDFEDETIEVKRAVKRREREITEDNQRQTELYIGEPKNESSYRVISVDKITLDYLERLKEYKINERVFNGHKGQILTTSMPRKWLRMIAKKAKIEPISVHGLRHTHTSLLIEAGANIKEIQYRLGHSNINTTLDIYSHLTERSKEDFAKQFSDYIKKQTEQPTEQD